MDIRKKLKEIIKRASYHCLPSNTQDFHIDMFVMDLLACGVTVQDVPDNDVGEWIPVKDRLPDVGSVVLVSDNETDCHIWQYTDYSERGVAMPWMDEFGIPCKTEEITHWMPLPQPPKGEWS